MKYSQLFTKTSKEAPKDEVAFNAQLLIRAGYVYKEMAGVYAYLPLGLRVIEKIKQITREEMNLLDAQEIIMTGLQRKELWETTDRWSDEKVDVWFKSELKNGTEVGFGWSHEEPISEMMKGHINSYKDLPVYVYQFQTKLRNELRAKSGIMRGREFVMKDMYSYSTDAEQHEAFYNSTIDAYLRVFERVGLGDVTHVTKASGGAFTQFSHEFQTLTDAGEDVLFQTGDGTWYNEEVAPAKMASENANDGEEHAYKEVMAMGVTGVEETLEHLNLPIEKSTKTLCYVTEEDEFIMAAVRSDRSINELKLAAVAGTTGVRMATEEEVQEKTGSETGYAGIVNIPEGVALYLDDSIEGMTNFETGGNKTGVHCVNVNFDRDLEQPGQFYDIKVAVEGDLDPESGKELVVRKAAEVGNIFNFGTVKSEQMNLNFTDADGKSVPVHLGSYGIGITRLMGVIVEHFADDKGIVWPESVAPFAVNIIPIGDSEAVAEATDKMYAELEEAGVEVLLDDRDMGPGKRFADHDLIGIPYRVVISAKTLEDGGKVEWKARTNDDVEMIDPSEVLGRLQ